MHFNIITANIRVFHTNVGELTHSFILKHKADVVFVTETKLDESIPGTYSRIPGYSIWHRRDRNSLGGGVALCHKNETRVQILEEVLPSELEIILFKIYDKFGDATLCLGCYRPPTQVNLFFNYIHEKLDFLINKHK